MTNTRDFQVGSEDICNNHFDSFSCFFVSFSESSPVGNRTPCMHERLLQMEAGAVSAQVTARLNSQETVQPGNSRFN